MFDSIRFGFVVVLLEVQLQYISKLIISAIVIAVWLREHGELLLALCWGLRQRVDPA
jgi:hypothetical protein